MYNHITSFEFIGQRESESLEYKAVLPPSRIIAQIVASFANTSGGHIILGISDRSGKPEIVGLSDDFHANEIVRKAITMLVPEPTVRHEYRLIDDKQVYVIEVEKAETPVASSGLLLRRKGEKTVFEEAKPDLNKGSDYARLDALASQLRTYKEGCSSSKAKFIEHLLSILTIFSDLKNLLYPSASNVCTEVPEGRILTRILFSSCADNLETYLSELLYEIFLARPETLKSDQQVTIREVLNCANMEEFVVFLSRKKLAKLQRGSVKGFIKDNAQITSLKAMSEAEENRIERIMQIRHLYAHRNGIVDEKFLVHFPGAFSMNEEHRLSADEVLDTILFLGETAHRIDEQAIEDYNLATL